jgi:hypothetical protein
VGAPPIEATTAYAPAASTRINGVFRIFPERAPRVVRMTTGIPRIVVPRVPPELS